MPPPRASLKSFLVSAKKAVASPSQQPSPLTFVVGNESADLDSICSAVVYAYLRTYASNPNVLHIPVSNIPRADLPLRPELNPVLSRANLKPSDLITLSDLPPADQRLAILPSEKTRWFLVDHNVLQGELGKIYGNRVIGCIDHHDDENMVPKDCGEEPRIVKKSGSCSSLVIEQCRVAWDALPIESTAEENSIWNSELAHVALAPILIDTANLTFESKTKAEDIEAAKYLESMISLEQGSHFTKEDYFKEISAAKADIGKLSLPEMLRKDYKQWTEGDVNLGVSSVVKDMPFLISEAGGEEKFYETIKEFAAERDLSICSIMTTTHYDGNFTRELFVWAQDNQGVKAAKDFEAKSTHELGLVQWKDGILDTDADSSFRRCWWQHKVEHSRKQVAPLLRASILNGRD